LNLANCDNLKWLPINVGAISALKELYLPCEGMISPPHEVVVSGSTATLDYSRGIWRGYLTGHVEILRTCLRQVPQEILSSNWAVIPAHCYDIMFPTGVGLLSKLSSLDCSMNKIQMIPFSICRMISLTKLNLADNAVCHIPSSLHMLTNLTHFDLSKNRLHELGEAFFETTSLKTLYLQENQLKIISDSLQKLVLLIRCSLAQNLLYELPHTITSLINLSSFDVVRPSLIVFLFSVT
jgi:Leucine-rich repeat (LRR) protein